MNVQHLSSKSCNTVNIPAKFSRGNLQYSKPNIAENAPKIFQILPFKYFPITSDMVVHDNQMSIYKTFFFLRH
jgi:hypothetical protein